MRTVLLLLIVGLGMRLLFWMAGPDGGAAWHIAFKGDAPVWQDLAARLAAGTPDAELRLPWRAPGMLWIVSLLWDGGGGGAWLPRLLCVIAGASIAPLLWLWLRPIVDATTAVVAAGVCAVASNMLVLSSGVHVEAPYLALTLATLVVQSRLRDSGWRLALAWGLVHGLLCLLRAEHLVTFGLLLGTARLTGVRWSVLGRGVVGALVALVPWQVVAITQVEDFNRDGAPRLTLALPWDDAAALRVESLPAFAQQGVFELVTATVLHRGGDRVKTADLAIVEEAYGSWPEPLPWPIIAQNGPINFFLANTPEADAGDHWGALQRPPPLVGGAERYPPALSEPTRQRFSLGYPPHLELVVHGYAHGIDETLAAPAVAARRLGNKVWQAIEGATGGLGGHALPIGLSGLRRPTDPVAAQGTWPAIWRVTVLAIAALGLWRLRKKRELWPMFAFVLSKVVIVVAFFGYVRHGALCLPLVAIGLGAVVSLLLRRWPTSSKKWLGLLILGALLAAEGFRARDVTATVDGQPMLSSEPFGADDARPRRIEFR